MIRPLTRDERRAWQLGTEDIATNARGFISAEVLAMNRRRYEATLAKQDAQIAALVKALRALMEWEPDEGHTRYDYDADLETIWGEATEAIEEATIKEAMT